ncbi:protein-methionine-sulfoxide reductase heme-binding subunit MsrQ [Sandaracinobacteroides hominis]|uniref:sulfite oxidase heme-binding subunit YedZ n=1 Tax=Sandaracinobacteroides hominis TaxID=2780086 RepID=UPI0018F544A9|nr:protein-methionine-sulfoxide reductase heme-binding subunit MsrQ [Sandaracinobacteroides hominis]
MDSPEPAKLRISSAARLNAPPRWLKPVVHLLAALPALWLLWAWGDLLFLNPASMQLSAEPVAYTHNLLGLTALRCLLACLAVTPVFKLSGWTPVMSLRRMLGLWAFAYAVAHLLFYMAMELDFSLTLLLKEVAKRQFILFGMLALLSMLPLALTSTRAAIKRLGGRAWQRLHRLVYLAGLAAAVHFILRVKGFQLEPWVYLVVLVLLLAIRLLPNRKRASRAAAQPA